LFALVAIPGTMKMKHLQENWESRDVDLTEEGKREMRRIIDVAKPYGNRYNEKSQSMVGH
jgi:diketogulonate reductase-like aldo/keto reductase